MIRKPGGPVVEMTDGRAVAHLAADAEVPRWNGQTLSSGRLAQV